MTFGEVMGALESYGTEQNRKVYQRHGAKPPLFGVSFSHLKKLKRQIRTDQALAEQLWNTGVADARHLAVQVADPKVVSTKLLDAWVADIDYYFLVDIFCRDLVSKSPFADNCLKWTRSHKEWTGRAGYMLLTTLLHNGEQLGQERLRGYIRDIEKEIDGSKNRVRDAMLHTLIAIGKHVPALRREVIAAARRIGCVEVKHGRTSCKTPDVVAELEAYCRKAE